MEKQGKWASGSLNYFSIGFLSADFFIHGRFLAGSPVALLCSILWDEVIYFIPYHHSTSFELLASQVLLKETCFIVNIFPKPTSERDPPVLPVLAQQRGLGPANNSVDHLLLSWHLVWRWTASFSLSQLSLQGETHPPSRVWLLVG